MTQVLVSAGLQEAERHDAASLYWQAFGAKLALSLGPEPRGVAFLARTIDPRFALTARDASGTLLGLAGFKTAEGGLIEAGWRDLRRAYGLWGALWRAPLLEGLSREAAPNALQMDGICVAPTARGMGVGTALLSAIKTEALSRDLTEVHLDVIDSNPRARALYLREGFEPTGTQDLGPFRYVYGFRTSEHMVARL